MSQRILKALALAAAGALAFTIVGVPAANGAATEVVDPVDAASEKCEIPINPEADWSLQLQPHSTALAPGQRVSEALCMRFNPQSRRRVRNNDCCVPEEA